ncbi:MAG: PKD domain-containing protein, partial [Bacteroidota bacterium]
TQQNPQHAYTAVGNYSVTLTATSNNGCTNTLAQAFTVNGDIPVADFNPLNPGTMCANDSISIQDASTVNFGSVTRIEIYWDNAGAPAVFQTDDFPTTGKTYRHLYPNFQSPLTKTFTIRYRAYSGGTCVNDRLKTITVNAAPKVQFNNMPDACLDAAPFQITQASEIGAVPGTGVFSGPGITAAGIFNPASVGAGTYIIKYTFTSSAGGCVDTLSKPIKVLDSASARFTYSAQTCEKSSISFNSSTSTIPAASGTITGWGWDFGDPASGAANISTLQNPSHVFSSWGTYTIKLVVITSNGCRSTVRTIPLFVNPIPKPNFTVPASACLPSANVTFNNLSTIADGTQGSFSYLWNFGDPGSGALNTSTGSSPSHIYNTAGPFNINLQVTSAAGCVHDTTITLSTLHPEPTGSFNVSKTDVCIGQSFTFTDNSDPADGTTTQWNWNLADGNTRTTPTFTYTYPTAGTYDVTLFITNSIGCRSSVATKRLTVNAYPLVNAGPDLFILEDGSDTIKPIITATNPTYLWTPNLHFLTSNTIRNPVVKGVENITYTITVTGQGDCVASDQVFITVLKGPEIPNIFSPNGDGVHDKWIIKYLDTYPEGTVEIFNRYGQLIFRSVGYNEPWDGTIDGKPVPMGTYYYIVNPKNGRKIMSGYVDVIR